MKSTKYLLAFVVGVGLMFHFNAGIWSQDAKDSKAEGKAAEEPKAEEKKPDPKPDNVGANNADTDWLSDAKLKEKLLDEKERGKATNEELGTAVSAIITAVGQNRAAINMFWTLMTGFLVMFMQAGFAMVETGLCRAKHVAHTMAMNFMIYALGMLGFYFIGFGLMFGGIGTSFFGNDPTLLTSEYKITVLGKELGIFGYDGFMLMGRAFDVSLMAIFLFQMVFMDTTCTIPTGAMAERWKFSAFVAFGLIISTVIYPIYGNWVWGGGWLAQLGSAFGLGHGHVDFAGSSVVHMTGGVCALVGALMIGPRIGKYGRDGSVHVLPAHSVPMYMVGTFILAFGWFGFNPGSSLKATDLNIARCAVNTMLASAAGAFVSMMYMWRVYGKPDPSFMCNGMLAGLVAITAPCAFITPFAAVSIGAVAGVLVIWSCLFWEKIAKVDDPVGAISVHGVNGAWGVLSLGLFADGSYGQGWNGAFWAKSAEGVTQLFEAADKIPQGWTQIGVTGLLYGNPNQLYAEAVGVCANIVYVGIASFIMFKVTDLVFGLRVAPEIELQGLDIPEMGVLGYINDDPTTPEGHLYSAGMDPKPARMPSGAGTKKFTVVVDGVTPEKIATIWSDLCQPTQKPSPDFLAVYPRMTVMQGNRFKFTDGNPEQMSAHMAKIFQLAGADGGKVKAYVEK